LPVTAAGAHSSKGEKKKKKMMMILQECYVSVTMGDAHFSYEYATGRLSACSPHHSRM
jgi:hypothetical protein